MKIYTKQGDEGETGLVGGSRINKDDVRIEAYGTVDELCATIGVVRSSQLAAPIEPILAGIQRDLFSLGAELASPESGTQSRIGATHVGRLEEWIDRWDSELPALKNFILPGGTPSAGFLHLARVICRRAERRVVRLARDAEIPPEIIPYLNRLSDLLFVLARLENHQAEVPDLIWTSDEDV